jgi:hypothetical protein
MAGLDSTRSVVKPFSGGLRLLRLMKMALAVNLGDEIMRGGNEKISCENYNNFWSKSSENFCS